MKENIIRMYTEERKTPTLIARDLKCDISIVNSIIDSEGIRRKLSSHNVENGKKRLKNVSISIEEIVRIYKDTKSTYRTSELTNISRYKLMKILKAENALLDQSEAASIRNKGYVARLAEQLKTEIKEVNRDVVYSSSKWSSLKALVKKHRNNKCEECGVSENLEVHHILPLALYPDAFFDVHNMRLFCEACHFKVGHHSDWRNINLTLVTDLLIEKYQIDRERLSEKTPNGDATV